MRAVAAGDSVAFSRLYDILSVATYTVLRRYLPDQADADIAMKAMWVSVWQNASALSHEPGTPAEKIVAVAERWAQTGPGWQSASESGSVRRAATT
ncbi:hypothetical protein GCM10007382_15900 [Salinibacterium xinjiangense]|nr:hypothetical protein GCM10007382_15900 [Salinibacterium xinjiangense]